MSRDILFRPKDDQVVDWLRVTAESNNRAVADEMRAAVSVYRDLVDLAHLRATRPEPGHDRTLQDLEMRLKDSIGRALLAGITEPARFKFEADAGVRYPEEGRVSRIVIPFEKLLGWIAGVHSS